MKLKFVAIFGTWFVAGVAGLLMAFVAATCTPAQRQIARTVIDIAHDACELFAVEQAKKLGVNPADVIRTACSTESDLQPWVDQILSAHRLAAQRMEAHPCAPGAPSVAPASSQ